MIYTITFNPSLDYIARVTNFTLGEINRIDEEEIFAGGKGINVSNVLKTLGIHSKTLGFIAGFSGDEIERLTKKQGLDSDFIRLPNGHSRINMKLKSREESEINGQGPLISQEALNVLFQQLDQLVEGDLLILAGSIPNTLPDDIYEKIMQRLEHKNIHFIVDATKELLVLVLKYKPFLIKPNTNELEEIFQCEIKDVDKLLYYAKKLKTKGAQNVLISRDKDGAILLCEDGSVFQASAPKGTLINSTGAGDSMVAGFAAGFLQNNRYEEALSLGIACGSATAFSLGLATKEKIEEVFKEVNITGGKQ